MPSRKTSQSKSSTRRSHTKKTPRLGLPGKPALDTDAISAMGERLDMMLPEVMARIAAVERLLVNKKVCSHKDLREARKYIDEQENF